MTLGSTKLHWHAGGGDSQRRKILQFVQEFVRREGYSPSYREIAEELGLAVSTVSYHVSVLKQEGLLRRETRQPRTIVEAAGPAPGRSPMRSRCRSSGRSRLASP